MCKLFVALGWFVVTTLGHARAAEEIRTFCQFYQLSLPQSREGRPVRIQGVVVCHDLDWGQLYVHDGAEVRWFNPREFSMQPTVGQLVEITGKTTVTGNDLALTNLSLAVLKEAALPAAKVVMPAQLTNGLGQWVEISGRVRVVDFSWGRMQLALHENGQGCTMFVLGPPQTNELKRLLGSRVRIRGINNSKIANGRLELASLFIPGMDQVTVLEPAGEGQLLPRATSIDSLLNRELGDWTNHPVRINGYVVSCEPGKKLIVKDPTGFMHVQIIQTTEVRSDDRVDVRGFLKVAPGETVLGDAWFEVIKPVVRPTAAAPAPASPAGPARRPEVLTRVADILKLRSDESAQRWPVRLRGVVLYADPEWRNGFLQDQRGAVYFDLSQTEVRAGQWVELTGETGPGGFAPEILNTSVKVLGTTNLPTPARVDLTDIVDGHLDAQWIEMEGVVRRTQFEWGHLTLNVMTDKGRFKAVIPRLPEGAAPTNLIDALVSIQGACGSDINARGQVSGVTLHTPDLDRIKILERPPVDPFSVAATPIAAVATFDPNRLAGRRVKVSGVVTLKIPDQGFFLQDDSGGIRVRLARMEEIKLGDKVEVLGFPALGDFSPELEDISFRPTGESGDPAPQATTAEEILLHGAHDGLVVTLEARLLQGVPRSANPQLVLQDGAIIFTARLEDDGQGWQMPTFAPGSVVRLSGVCSIQRGEQHEPKSFRLRLRSPADVSLISSPPWWTARNTLWVFGGLGAVLLLALVWVRALRRQVAWQTRKLRDEIAERERMQLQIEKTHKDLLHTSRQAGMAEVATSVLHNVGNVLNSVNTSASLISDRLRTSKSDGAARIADLLEQHRHDLPGFFSEAGRTDQVINFLRKLGEHLAADRKTAMTEIAELGKNIEHIKEIVAMQQSYARVSGVKERINVTDLVEDALRMNTGALARHQVRLVRDYAPRVPEITVDKHKVLQVLVNLIRNAKYACDESNRTDKEMTVRVTNGNDRVRIAIVDNGVGILPENMARIFSHGFTTRKEGHGFGLHSGALAAKELGGALVAHSEGSGRGASFTLELPLADNEKTT